jgi:hypothetical protein
MNWRPPTFTDMQLNSKFDQNQSNQGQKFDMFSNNNMNPFDIKQIGSNKILSPEPIRSTKESQEKRNSNFNDNSFAEKLFKNMNKRKNTPDNYSSNRSGNNFFKNGIDTRNKSRMMHRIVEQNENTVNKQKINKSLSKGVYFTNNTLSKLTKRSERNSDSTAIKININEKKRHAFNSTFGIQSILFLKNSNLKQNYL